MLLGVDAQYPLQEKLSAKIWGRGKSEKVVEEGVLPTPPPSLRSHWLM